MVIDIKFHFDTLPTHMFLKILFIIPLVYIMGCSSSSIIRDKEYSETTQFINRSNLDKAIERFPQKEKNGFITTFEKSWLQYWEGKNKDMTQLKEQALSFDQRHYISLSKEGEQWLFQESADGYIPSEHEVISHYLLLVQYEIDAGHLEEARVDLKKATEILQKDSRQVEMRFDDPSLRLWIATLWIALGEWNEAQVDLRRIYELTQDKSYLFLSERSTPPKDWNLIFWGSTPSWSWLDSQLAPQFLETKKPILSANLEYDSKNYYTSTLPLFKRHVDRLQRLREFALKSNYMTQFISDEALEVTQKSSATIAAGTIATTGLIVGGAFVLGGLYLLSNSNIGGDAVSYVVQAGVVIGGLFYSEAKSSYDRWLKEIESDREKSRNDRRTYRFVRYFPSWIILSTNSFDRYNSYKKVLNDPLNKSNISLNWLIE